MQKLFKVIVVLFLLLILIFITKMFLMTSFFYVRSVEIKGEITNKDLKSQLEKNFEYIIGKNIVFINEDKIRETLSDDVRIKNISVEKYYPSKLEVSIEERKAYVYVKRGNKFYLADRDLNLFGRMDEIGNESMPIISFENEDEKKDIREILLNIQSKSLYDVISEIKRNNNRSYELILVNGVRIITNSDVSSEKYDKVIKLYDRIKANQPVNYMDIRFKNVNVK